MAFAFSVLMAFFLGPIVERLAGHPPRWANIKVNLYAQIAGLTAAVLLAPFAVTVSRLILETLGGALLSVAANTTLTGAVLNAASATLTAANQTLISVTGGTLSAGKLIDLSGSSVLALGSGKGCYVSPSLETAASLPLGCAVLRRRCDVGCRIQAGQ